MAKKCYFENFQQKIRIYDILEYGVNNVGQKIAKVTFRRNSKRGIWVPESKLIIE